MTIQELFREHGVDFASHGEHHHARAEWLAVHRCPFCSSSNYHLGWSLRAHFFSCWKCGGHRTVDTLIRLGVPAADAWDFYNGRSLLRAEEKKARAGLKEPPGRGPLLKAHLRYLEGRGFDPEELERTWGLEGIGRNGGNLSWRIYIPILLRGRRVSWTTRAIGNGAGSRYVSAGPDQEAVDHKSLVYGRDLIRASVVVVEGPADAWKVGPGAGALLGVSYTPAQVLALSKIPYRVICFDSSPDAQRRAVQLAFELAPFPGETTGVTLDSPDPGSAPRKEIALLRKIARLDS